MKFDSIAEQSANTIFEKYGCTSCTSSFEALFYDKSGASFIAKPDFYHAKANLYIEFKSSSLNSKTTKAASEKALASQMSYRAYRRQPLQMIDILNMGWNHSAYKQAIVQSQLTSQRFIIVFAEFPSWEEAKRLHRHNLIWCTLQSFPSYLARVRFANAGFNMGWKVEYEEGYIRC